MRFDGFDSIEGRHLVFAYAAVLLLQSGYLGWMLYQWQHLRPESGLRPERRLRPEKRLRPESGLPAKKTTKPL